MAASIRCHYEVLGVERDADTATIKKAHRRKALQYHPDKNLDDPAAAEQFRLVQQAYECLSDAVERKWYDEHREAILKGWSGSGGDDEIDILFDVVPFMYAGCYNGYDDAEGGFYAVYRRVFHKVYEAEQESGDSHLPADFGTSTSSWEDVAAFYLAWESFASVMSFAWADQYNIQEAENRRVRRAMEDENKKARKAAKRQRTEDVVALVRFVKRRDPRVKLRKQQMEEEKTRKEMEQKDEAARKRKESQKAREKWREQTEEDMAATEQVDRLAGRIRLADLEDDYDYGGKKGKKGKKKKGKVKQSVVEQDDEADKDVDDAENDGAVDEKSEPKQQESESVDSDVFDDDDEPDTVPLESESEEEEEPDVWRCECCKKDFKSEGQMENHMKSKKHKQAYKKYEAMLEQQIMQDMLR